MDPVYLSPDFFSQYSHSLTATLLGFGALLGLILGYLCWGVHGRSAKQARIRCEQLDAQVEDLQNRRRSLLDRLAELE